LQLQRQQQKDSSDSNNHDHAVWNKIKQSNQAVVMDFYCYSKLKATTRIQQKHHKHQVAKSLQPPLVLSPTCATPKAQPSLSKVKGNNLVRLENSTTKPLATPTPTPQAQFRFGSNDNGSNNVYNDNSSDDESNSDESLVI
jgi:hypothetical protein